MTFLSFGAFAQIGQVTMLDFHSLPQSMITTGAWKAEVSAIYYYESGKVMPFGPFPIIGGITPEEYYALSSPIQGEQVSKLYIKIKYWKNANNGIEGSHTFIGCPMNVSFVRDFPNYMYFASPVIIVN